MPILSVWLINKSGGLVFQKDFPTDSFVIPKLSTNDILVLASTFQRYKLVCILLYCIVLYCILLYCVLYCIVLCIVLCIVYITIQLCIHYSYVFINSRLLIIYLFIVRLLIKAFTPFPPN